jgi:predicted amidophosphoribosyltransferase
LLGNLGEALKQKAVEKCTEKDAASSPIIILENAREELIDEVLLIRFARSRSIEEMLVSVLAPTVTELKKLAPVAITSMPERCEASSEHTFIRLVRRIAKRLEIEFVNDRFKETAKRPSMTNFKGTDGEREETLAKVIEYDGRLDGKITIVIDDVVTTGSSLKIATRKLKETGARAVIAVGLLKGPKEWERNQAKSTIRKYNIDFDSLRRLATTTRAMAEMLDEMESEDKAASIKPRRNPGKLGQRLPEDLDAIVPFSFEKDEKKNFAFLRAKRMAECLGVEFIPDLFIFNERLNEESVGRLVKNHPYCALFEINRERKRQIANKSVLIVPALSVIEHKLWLVMIHSCLWHETRARKIFILPWLQEWKKEEIDAIPDIVRNEGNEPAIILVPIPCEKVTKEE